MKVHSMTITTSLLSAVVFLLLSMLPVQAEMLVLTTIEPPTNYVQDGEIVGTSVDVVREILRRMNVDAEIEVKPWARVLNIAQTTPNVMLFTCGRTQERVDCGFHFIGPVVSRKHAVYKKKESRITVTSLEDIKQQGLVVGGVHDDWRSLMFESKGLRVDIAPTHAQCVEKMFGDRFPLLIGSDIEVPEWLEQTGRPADSLEVAFVFMEAPSFIMLSKHTSPALVHQVREVFRAMQQTDFFEMTAAKYTEILKYKLEYSPEKGFHRPE
ncbi:transporter substrate-binding domain-containing protein [Desulfovibrio mangrovi]|uniref:substrate-binding periplasmic protein n=1 Tax=Desulfovibrio mangrovi TaxID=2976983 RepID=UPI00224867B7|nr:transporter substrate-binding domain-containing protein [Desulfovibrio mangrovi]UZP69192.1 transporter substrate-binding domain-containing protein [Desulfovibrio mangrovi]